MFLLFFTQNESKINVKSSPIRITFLVNMIANSFEANKWLDNPVIFYLNCAYFPNVSKTQTNTSSVSIVRNIRLIVIAIIY